MRGMKACLRAAFVILAVCHAACAGSAGTGTLTMSATVVGTCQVTTPPGVLDFGVIDPSGSSNVTASTTFAIKCTKNTVSTAATDNGGANFSGTKRMKHSTVGTAFLPYAVSYAGAAGFTGQGFAAAAAAQTVTVNGVITPAQYQSARVTGAGEIYSDTVTITVNP